MLVALALAVVLGGCGTFPNYVGLGTNEAGWKQAGSPAAAALTWRGNGASLLVAAEFEPCELPVTVRVTNLLAGDLRVVVGLVSESSVRAPARGTWSTEDAQDPPQTYDFGTEIVVPGASAAGEHSTLHLKFPADRDWTAVAPVLVGDAISYDLTLSRGSADPVRPLRFEVVYVGNDFHWWTLLVYAGVIAGAIAAPEIALRVFLNALH